MFLDTLVFAYVHHRNEPLTMQTDDDQKTSLETVLVRLAWNIWLFSPQLSVFVSAMRFASERGMAFQGALTAV